MNALALGTLIVVTLFVWGGLAVIVSLAWRREAAKPSAPAAGALGPAPPTGGVYPRERPPGRGSADHEEG